jgi:hypothetical protein
MVDLTPETHESLKRGDVYRQEKVNNHLRVSFAIGNPVALTNCFTPGRKQVDRSLESYG